MWRRLRTLLALVGLCAVATCPTAQRSCTARTRAAEADGLLDYLADRVADRVASTGRVPPTAAELAPAVGCCEQGGQCQPDPAAWAAPGWRELAFTIDDPHRFRYAYLPDPSGLGATVRAIGDLACDGAPLQIELKLTVVGGKLVRARTRGAPPP